MAFFTRSENPPRVRRILDNVIYDTAKADLIAAHVKRRSAGDWHYFSQETLYRTKQGNWFYVVGQRFNIDHHPEMFIQPATPEQAYAWLCEFNEIDLIERFFAGKAKYA